MDEPQLMPLGAMARIAHVAPGWLRAEADAGRLPHLRAGDRYLFVPAIILRILRKRAAGREVAHD